MFPNTKSDFAKDGVPAKWAPGHPKEWGMEEFQVQFSAPEPLDNFQATVSPDEKYLALFNGSHVRVTDLDTANNAVVTTIPFALPDNYRGTKGWALDLSLRARSQGGYDVLVDSGDPYGSAEFTARQILSADAQPIGTLDVFDGGKGSVSPTGLLATNHANVYDLESSRIKQVSALQDATEITDLSLGPDGVRLATVSWNAETTPYLWNATSGAKIFTFPETTAQNWLVRISPDGEYVAMCLGSAIKTIQIYSLRDLQQAPIEITGFNDWPREMSWSPTSKQIAVGDNGRLHVFDVPSKALVQRWQVDAVDFVYTPWGSQWLDGGKKIAWIWRDGKYLYDFETNTEWLWTVRRTDRVWGPANLYYLKKKGYVVTVDGDSTVRFWKL